jgi:hypothetical protein
MSSDYPFTSWAAYYAALTESLQTEYYGETYPEYQKFLDDEKGNTDDDIIKGLLDTGLNPQEGLDGFIEALLDGSRYASEMAGIDDILVMFIEKGAVPKIDCLFTILYPEGDYFEDEVQSYEIRGELIDSLQEYIQADKFYDWSSIEATHWEDIEKNIIKTDYKKACYMYLKQCSDFLQSL